MSFLRNKHVVTSLLVAPLLALSTYFLVDYWMSEKPSMAIAGETYQLIAKSDCRYQSGMCSLENGNFKVTIRLDEIEGDKMIILQSNKSLQSAWLGFVTDEGVEHGPFDLNSKGVEQTQWVGKVGLGVNDEAIMRLALRANDAYYYSETTMGFSHYQTSFEQDFRKQQ